MKRVQALIMTLLMATTVSTVWGLSDVPIEDRLEVNGGVIFTILQSENTVYLGGQFDTVGGLEREYVAAFNSTTGDVLEWYPNRSALVTFDTMSFGISGDKQRVFIGDWSLDFLSCDPALGNVQWATPMDNILNPGVFSIAVDGNVVYIGGYFNSVQNTSRNNIVRLNGATGLLDETWAPNPNSLIHSIQVYNGKVYVGGSFTNIANQSKKYLVRFDAKTGILDDWVSNLNSGVSAMFIYKGTLYVGGAFTQVGNETRNRLASFELRSGALTSWAPSVDDATPEVKALSANNGRVYVGGDFSSINGTARMNLAALDATTGELDSWNPAPNGDVNSLHNGSTHLMVGGDFTSMGAGSGPAYFAEFYDPREHEPQEFNARPYPNPYRPSQGHTDMTIDQLPPGATVKIYSMNGQLVKSMTAGDEGEVVWAGVRNDDGAPVSSGVYFGVAEGNGESKMFKVIVQR